MGEWEKVGRRQRKAFNRSFLGLGLFGCVLLVGIAKIDTPSTTTYTSNAEVPARPTTTHRFTPTTTARVSSAVSAEKVIDEIVIVDGQTVYRIPRSSAVMVALYILLENTK